MTLHPASPQVIAEAARLLRAGQLVAFPTETVYGLGAHALDERAVRRIFEAKGRPSFNPVIVHVGTIDDARRIVSHWPSSADRLAAAFWPGPLTLVLPKQRAVPDIVTAGLPSVAVRIPSHPVALALLQQAAIPIAAPSANRSTALSPTTAHHVEKSLGERVAMIIDGGPTTVGIESTVVDVTSDTPIVLRPGAITVADLSSILGVVSGPTAAAGDDAPRPSPGMMERHYAPRAAVVLVDRDDDGDVAKTARRVDAAVADGGRVAVLTRHPSSRLEGVDLVRMPTTPDEYARELYARLHALDDAGYELIVVERVPTTSEWMAIADRLTRGAR